MIGNSGMVLRLAAGLSAISAAAAPVASAQGLIVTHRIPAALANEAVGEAVATCARQGYHETSVLVDAFGNVQAVLWGDGAGAHAVENATAKAFTSAAYKSDTGALVQQAKTREVSPALTRLPRLILSQGAVVVKSGDEVIGAIGASGAPGGEKDEACARAGLAKISDRLK
jgi:uncharacterized protein GlcG (DUF336 family)